MIALIKITTDPWVGEVVRAVISPDRKSAAVFLGGELFHFQGTGFQVLEMIPAVPCDIKPEVSEKTSLHFKETQEEQIRKLTGLPFKKLHLSMTFE